MKRCSASNTVSLAAECISEKEPIVSIQEDLIRFKDLISYHLHVDIRPLPSDTRSVQVLPFPMHHNKHETFQLNFLIS